MENIRLRIDAFDVDEYIKVIAFVVFEDYVKKTTPEEFQMKFGTLGTEHLARVTEQD